MGLINDSSKVFVISADVEIFCGEITDGNVTVSCVEDFGILGKSRNVDSAFEGFIIGKVENNSHAAFIGGNVQIDNSIICEIDGAAFDIGFSIKIQGAVESDIAQIDCFDAFGIEGAVDLGSFEDHRSIFTHGEICAFSDFKTGSIQNDIGKFSTGFIDGEIRKCIDGHDPLSGADKVVVTHRSIVVMPVAVVVGI